MAWPKSLRADVRRWRSLARRERRTAVRAAAALTATWIALRLMRIGRWHAILARLTPSRTSLGAPGAPPLDSAPALAHMVDAVARRLPWRCQCLERATALWWLLSRTGVPAAIRLGVMKDGQGIAAHAWVEVDGVSLDDSPGAGPRFQAFARPVDPLSVR